MKVTIATALLLAMVLIASTSTAQPAPALTTAPTYSNRIVFIRHAEKGFTPDQGFEKRPPPSSQSFFWKLLPPWGPPGGGRGPPGGPGRKFPNGLNDQGRERAQYIRRLFGAESDYDFGLIFAAPRDAAEKETERTYATVAPLAKDLGLDINIDCANAEASCIVSVVEKFASTSEKDILVSWKHRDLNVIATALGAPNAKRIYPDERNDVIWIMQNGEIVEKRSMHCPVLDDERKDAGDPDLEVERPAQSWSTWFTLLATGPARTWWARRRVVNTESVKPQ